jgi:hypothetical protein
MFRGRLSGVVVLGGVWICWNWDSELLLLGLGDKGHIVGGGLETNGTEDRDGLGGVLVQRSDHWCGTHGT